MASRSTKNKSEQINTAVADVQESSADVEAVAAENQSFNVVPHDVPLTQIVTVKNGFHGTLVYKSRKTGERFVWDSFGAEQDMEIGELRNARNSNKSFFVNNWFMFDEAWIVDYLGVRQFYKFALSLDEFDSLFDKTPDEVMSVIKKLSDGQKRSVAYFAKEKISDGTIDSHKMIKMLEDVLGVELIEKV